MPQPTAGPMPTMKEIRLFGSDAGEEQSGGDDGARRLAADELAKERAAAPAVSRKDSRTIATGRAFSQPRSS